MTSARRDERMFLVAAIWNFAASVPTWIAGLAAPAVFGLFGMARPPDLAFFSAMLGFIFAFGVGYLVVSRDTTKNRGVVLVAVVAKSVVVLDFAVIFARGEANFLLLGCGLVDLVFVFLFVEFLRRTRDRSPVVAR